MKKNKFFLISIINTGIVFFCSIWSIHLPSFSYKNLPTKIHFKKMVEEECNPEEGECYIEEDECSIVYEACIEQCNEDDDKCLDGCDEKYNECLYLDKKK